MVGPTVQQDLCNIIVRFRQHPYATTADVTKMYRQILIREQDRKFQRILWKEASDQPIKIYELNTVTYGTSLAPFQAIRCLHQLSMENEESYSLGNKVIVEDFYVDVLIAGASSIEGLQQVRQEVSTIFSRRKIRSTEMQIERPKLFRVSVR